MQRLTPYAAEVFATLSCSSNPNMHASMLPGKKVGLTLSQRTITTNADYLDRKTVDPPPIVQLRVSKQFDAEQQFLQSMYRSFFSTLITPSTKPGSAGPYYFMTCNLVGSIPPGQSVSTLGQALTGNVVSSLHRLKDADGIEGAFFIFADLSVKVEGSFRLEFNLFEMRENDCVHITAVRSESFEVLPKKSFAGMMESTTLTRTFSDQGVRLRLRKEPRALLKKRGPASDDYEPRHYKTTTQKRSGSKYLPSHLSIGSYRRIDENVRPHQEFAAAYGSGHSTYTFQQYQNMPQLSYNKHSGSTSGKLAHEVLQTGTMRQHAFENSPFSIGSYGQQSTYYASQNTMAGMAYPMYSASQSQLSSHYVPLQNISASQGESSLQDDSGFVSESHHSPSLYIKSSPQAQQPGQYQAFAMVPPGFLSAFAADDSMVISPIDRFSSGSDPISASAIPGGAYDLRQPTYQNLPWNAALGHESTNTPRDDKEGGGSRVPTHWQNAYPR